MRAFTRQIWSRRTIAKTAPPPSNHGSNLNAENGPYHHFWPPTAPQTSKNCSKSPHIAGTDTPKSRLYVYFKATLENAHCHIHWPGIPARSQWKVAFIQLPAPYNFFVRRPFFKKLWPKKGRPVYIPIQHMLYRSVDWAGLHDIRRKSKIKYRSLIWTLN